MRFNNISEAISQIQEMKKLSFMKLIEIQISSQAYLYILYEFS
jgi:hypothetical protein